MKKLIAAVMLFGSGVAQAALIERDLNIADDGLLTYDEQTGLEWLDWTATLGESAIDIRDGSGNWISQGFRFATRQEVTALIQNAGLTLHFSYLEEEYLQGLALMSLVGQTSNVCADSKLPSANGTTMDIVNICPINGGTAAVIFTDYVPLAEPEPGYIDQYYGSALVRTSSVVPIPAAVWLFASGLGLLGWLRRRQAA